MCLAHGLNPMKVYLLRETLSHSPSPWEMGPPLESIPAVLTHPTRCRFGLPLVSPWKMVPSCTPFCLQQLWLGPGASGHPASVLGRAHSRLCEPPPRPFPDRVQDSRGTNGGFLYIFLYIELANLKYALCFIRIWKTRLTSHCELAELFTGT